MEKFSRIHGLCFDVKYLFQRTGSKTESLCIADTAGNKEDEIFVFIILAEEFCCRFKSFGGIVESERESNALTDIIIFRTKTAVVHYAEHEIVQLDITESIDIFINPDFIGRFQIDGRCVVSHKGDGTNPFFVTKAN